MGQSQTEDLTITRQAIHGHGDRLGIGQGDDRIRLGLGGGLGQLHDGGLGLELLALLSEHLVGVLRAVDLGVRSGPQGEVGHDLAGGQLCLGRQGEQDEQGGERREQVTRHGDLRIRKEWRGCTSRGDYAVIQ